MERLNRVLERVSHGLTWVALAFLGFMMVAITVDVESPGAANARFELVAGARDQIGQCCLVVEAFELAAQMRGGVVPGRHARGFDLVRVPARRHIGVRAVDDHQRRPVVRGLRIRSCPVAINVQRVTVASVQHRQLAGVRCAVGARCHQRDKGIAPEQRIQRP